MSQLDYVRNALWAFLEDERPGILAIKGPWGVGKTYFWTHFINENKSELTQSAYSYVSLFGIGSIAELKRSIFTKHTPLGGEWARLARRFTKGVSHLPKVFEFAGTKIGSLKRTEVWADMIQERMVRNFLICIDDLERKETSLSASALLGLITSLREERNCKIVLLYNESEIEPKSELESSLAEYREKVFDREVAFTPSVEDCFKIIFSSKTDNYQFAPSTEVGLFGNTEGSVFEIFSAANVTNIRVIEKTKVALDYFKAELSDKYPNLWPDFARQVTKLCCLHYIHGDAFALETLINTSSWSDIFLERSDDAVKHEAFNKRKPIREIGYNPIPTDQIIVEFLRTGFVVWQNHEQVLNAQEEKLKAGGIAAEHRAIWSKLWANFQASEADFIAAQVAFIEKNLDRLSLSDVDGAVQFVRKIEPNEKLEALLTKKISDTAVQLEDDDVFDGGMRNVSAETVNRVKQGWAQKGVIKPISEALELMTRGNGWNPRDIKYLVNVTEDQFFDYFVSDKGDELLHRIKEFRSRFSSISEASAVMARVDAALKRLAERSKFDAIRVYSNIGLPAPEANKPSATAET